LDAEAAQALQKPAWMHAVEGLGPIKDQKGYLTAALCTSNLDKPPGGIDGVLSRTVSSEPEL
jgi:hypothetical protein